MAMMRRITEGEIIVVETMIIVGEIVTVQINGELVRYEILSVRQLWVRAFSSWSEANKFRITRNRPDWRIVCRCIYNIMWKMIEDETHTGKIYVDRLEFLTVGDYGTSRLIS